ncbi:MAG: O-antigen ligase family protein [Nitrosomonas sp.]|nr:O-antigen ligase family protein [Nitrosomonas sp.]
MANLLGFDRLTAFQRELFIRSVLIFFCVGLWFGSLYTVLIILLLIAWQLDGDAQTFKELLKEPFVQAIIILCSGLLLGLIWSETSLTGRHKWAKYLLLLTYIPFMALLNKQRLPWVIGAVIAGYCLILFVGLYAWYAEQEQGVPAFDMTYLTFSAMLGIGSIVFICSACMCRHKMVQAVYSVAALLLLYLQFHQGARGFLLATLLTLVFVLINHFRLTLRTVSIIAVALALIAAIFSYASPTIQNRWVQARLDLEHMQQGNYNNSIGYRIALWDVGIYGIAEKPILGHGTGMPERYFDQTVVHYKNGIYADLPAFQTTSHYHNDWIEMGMQLGALGIVSLLYLLWAWYRTFARNQLILPGIALVIFVVLSGMTETFLIFARMPVLLLVITAIVVSWQKNAMQSYPRYP